MNSSNKIWSLFIFGVFLLAGCSQNTNIPPSSPSQETINTQQTSQNESAETTGSQQRWTHDDYYSFCNLLSDSEAKEIFSGPYSAQKPAIFEKLLQAGFDGGCEYRKPTEENKQGADLFQFSVLIADIDMKEGCKDLAQRLKESGGEFEELKVGEVSLGTYASAEKNYTAFVCESPFMLNITSVLKDQNKAGSGIKVKYIAERLLARLKNTPDLSVLKKLESLAPGASQEVQTMKKDEKETSQITIKEEKIQFQLSNSWKVEQSMPGTPDRPAAFYSYVREALKNDKKQNIVPYIGLVSEPLPKDKDIDIVIYSAMKRGEVPFEVDEMFSPLSTDISGLGKDKKAFEDSKKNLEKYKLKLKDALGYKGHYFEDEKDKSRPHVQHTIYVIHAFNPKKEKGYQIIMDTTTDVLPQVEAEFKKLIETLEFTE